MKSTIFIAALVFLLSGCGSSTFETNTTKKSNQNNSSGNGTPSEPTTPSNPTEPTTPPPTEPTNPPPNTGNPTTPTNPTEPVTPPPSTAIVFPVESNKYYDEREIIVRSMRNFEQKSNVARVLDLVKKYDFTTISFSVKQDEDDPDETISGQVFFPSTIAPQAARYKNWDVVADVITAAKARGLKTKAWFPLFHDQVAATKKADWAMKALVNGKVVTYQGSNPSWPEHFANPLNTEVQDYQISLIKEFLAKYDVDSLVIDWVRFDEYNMDMSDKTRADFKALHGIDPVTIDFTWGNDSRNKWNEFRRTRLASFVEKLVKEARKIRPNIEIGAYVLPPEFEECGQDSAKIAPHLDFLSPMVYFKDFNKQISWVYNSVIKDVVNKSNGKKTTPVYAFSWSASEYKDINTNVAQKFQKIRSASYFKYQWWDEQDFQNARSGIAK